MIQDRIYNYFQRNPQLHVLFIFDKANIIMNDLADCEWKADYIYKVFDGAWFNTKYHIEYTWKDKRVVLLFPLGTYPVSEEQQLKFPLMDVLRANMEYKEEDFATFMQQYQLPEKFRTFISRHIGELMSNKIQTMLKDRFTPDAFSEDMVLRGFISAYLGDKKLLDWDMLLVRIFILGLESESKKRLDFYHKLEQNLDAKRALDERLTKIFGFSYQPNREEKVKELVESLKYNSMTQLLEVQPNDVYKKYKVANSLSLELMNRMYELGCTDRIWSEKFTNVLEQLGSAIREDEIVGTYGIDASYYQLTEKLGWMILKALATTRLVAEPVETQKKLRQLSQKFSGESSVQLAIGFLTHTACYYEKVKDLGSLKLNSTEAYVQLYIHDLYRLDTAYRCASEAYHALLAKDVPIHTCLNELKQKFDADYARLTNVLNLEWMNCVEEKSEYFRGLSLNRLETFYANECDGNTRQVVIISDALRYEVAAELIQELSKMQINAKLSAYRAMLPTETKYCKLALLPHNSLTWTGKDMAVDGEVRATLESRTSLLETYREGACCVDYETVMTATPKIATELFKHSLVYIFHDTIDTASHGAGGADVVEACRKAIEQLSGLVRKLHASWKIGDVILTADHGFIYNDIPFEEKDKHSVTSENVLEKKTRYYLSSCQEAQEGICCFPLQEVSGIESETPLFVCVPKGTNRLAAAGGYRFAHGGATLQEMIVPVIHSSRKKADKATKVGVTLLDHNLMMVSSRLKFHLIQSEAISMAVVKRDVVCGVYQGDQLVTNEVRLTLDSADSLNLNNRVFEVVLTLAQPTASGMLQLRIYDDKDRLNPLIKEAVKNNTMIEQDF